MVFVALFAGGAIGVPQNWEMNVNPHWNVFGRVGISGQIIDSRCSQHPSPSPRPQPLPYGIPSGIDPILTSDHFPALLLHGGTPIGGGGRCEIKWHGQSPDD